MQKAKGWALALITRGETLRGAPFSGMARHRLVTAFLRYSGAVYAVHPLGFVAQLKRRVSYPYPRRTYAIATVSGVPSWVNRLSKAART